MGLGGLRSTADGYADLNNMCGTVQRTECIMRIGTSVLMRTVPYVLLRTAPYCSVLLRTGMYGTVL